MTEFLVEDPGLLATVQDLGRPGLAHLGVPRSGALDPDALRLANRLVGNPEAAAGLELTATGAALRFAGAVTVAVTGARCTVAVAGRAAAWGAPISRPAGARIVLGPAFDGLRSYLAISGGVVVPPVLGSRSTDLLSGIGPEPLRAEDRLPIGRERGTPSGAEAVPRRTDAIVRLIRGPREDWFTDEALHVLDGARYTVRPTSNRIGVRLDGPVLARRDPEAELVSEPMVLGAVQVPPSGQPLVFLHDHPTTGGYPVIGVVDPRDLVVCAQARPGDLLTLRWR